MLDQQQPPDASSVRRGLAVRTAVVTLVVAAVVSLLALLILVAQVWLLIFAGLLFAVLLSAAVDVLSRWSGLGRGASLAVVVVTLTATMIAAAYALWPSVSQQADQLATELPAAVRELRGWIADRAWGEWLLGRADPEQVVDSTGVLSQATGAVMSTASAIGGLLVILFVGLYVAAQPGIYHHGVRRLVPVRARVRADGVLYEIVDVLRWWLVGKLLSMSVVGVLTTVEHPSSNQPVHTTG